MLYFYRILMYVSLPRVCLYNLLDKSTYFLKTQLWCCASFYPCTSSGHASFQTSLQTCSHVRDGASMLRHTRQIVSFGQLDLVFNLQRVVINVLDKWEERSDFWTYNNFLQERYILRPTYEDD